MYTVVHYTALHFQGPQSSWGALAVYKVTHVGSLHVYCSTLLCTFRWTQSTWGALAVYQVTHVGSLHVYCSTLLCTFRWTQSTWGALAGCSVTQITTHHIYCSTLHCHALSGSSKYLGSISCLQSNACRLTPCIL